MPKKSIAILGGMGPEASEYMYSTLINLSVKEFDAKHNDEFPDIVLFSVPVPDFISDEVGKQEALEMLISKVKSISPKSVLCFGIACNTAHLLLDDLQKETKVPFVSMIDEMVADIKSRGFRTVGLMSTPMTLKTRLYTNKFEQEGISVVVPNVDQISILESVIRNVIAKKNTVDDEIRLQTIADDLRDKGAEAIILGCTELPLVYPLNYELPVFNSVSVLANVLLRKYYQQNTMRKTKKV